MRRAYRTTNCCAVRLRSGEAISSQGARSHCAIFRLFALRVGTPCRLRLLRPWHGLAFRLSLAILPRRTSTVRARIDGQMLARCPRRLQPAIPPAPTQQPPARRADSVGRSTAKAKVPTAKTFQSWPLIAFEPITISAGDAAHHGTAPLRGIAVAPGFLAKRFARDFKAEVCIDNLADLVAERVSGNAEPSDRSACLSG